MGKGRGWRVFSPIEPNCPLPYTVQYRASTAVEGCQTGGCFSICASTTPKAQKRTAKGSILKEY